MARRVFVLATCRRSLQHTAKTGTHPIHDRQQDTAHLALKADDNERQCSLIENIIVPEKIGCL